MGFAGQSAVVTGGESGIGKACALALARAGAAVTITYYSDRVAAHAVCAAAEQAGARARAVRTDVSDEAQVEALFAAAEQAHGPVRLLVNSAGRNMTGTPFGELATETFDRIVETDLRGPFLTCRRFVRGLGAVGGGGRIVNVSSIHERAPRAGAAAYDAAKGGLAQLTTTLALELASTRIAVNAVAPGMILTPMNQSALDDAEALARKERAIPWGRAGRAEEVADAVLFLLSDAADYVTGATLTIDGGLSLTVAQGA